MPDRIAEVIAAHGGHAHYFWIFFNGMEMGRVASLNDLLLWVYSIVVVPAAQTRIRNYVLARFCPFLQPFFWI